MKLEVDMTLDDVVAAQQHLEYRQRTSKLVFVVSAAIALALVCLIAAHFAGGAVPAWLNALLFWIGIVPLILVWAICTFLFYLERLKRTPQQIKSHVESQVRVGNVALGSHTFSLESDGVRHGYAGRESMWLWEMIERIEESNQVLMICLEDFSNFAIPKRAFASMSDVEHFKDTVDHCSFDAAVAKKLSKDKEKFQES